MGFAVVIVTSPWNSVCPGFTTSPVANEIFISRVNKSIKSSVQEVSDLWRKIKHPVTKKCGMDSSVAFRPGSTLNTKNFLSRFLEEKVISWRHIVAKWWMSTWFSDIVNVESWNWSSKDNFGGKLVFFKSDWPNSGSNQSLASSKSTLKDGSGGLANEVVLKGEDIILWVLDQWVNKTVTDGHTFEVNLQFILVLE